MNIEAKYFGNVTYDNDDVIQILNGLFGFEEYSQYLCIPFQEDDSAMLSLQSLDDENLSFVLMDPFTLVSDYALTLSAQDKKELEINDNNDNLACYVICVIRDSVATSTVNLKAPLAINTVSNKAKQIMLENTEYTFRHELGGLMKKED